MKTKPRHAQENACVIALTVLATILAAAAMYNLTHRIPIP